MSSRSIALCPVKVDEVDELYSLIRKYAEECGWIDELYVEANNLREAIFKSNCVSFQFIIVNSSRVGFACTYFEFVSFHPGRAAYIEDLYVLPSSRASGVGTAVMEMLFAQYASVGCHRVRWAVPKFSNAGLSLAKDVSATEISDYMFFKKDLMDPPTTANRGGASLR